MLLRILEMTKIKYKVCKLSHLQKYPKLVNLNQFNRMSRYKDKKRRFVFYAQKIHSLSQINFLEAGLSKDSGAKIMIQMNRKIHVNLQSLVTSILAMKVNKGLKGIFLFQMNQLTSVLFV